MRTLITLSHFINRLVPHEHHFEDVMKKVDELVNTSKLSKLLTLSNKYYEDFTEHIVELMESLSSSFPNSKERIYWKLEAFKEDIKTLLKETDKTKDFVGPFFTKFVEMLNLLQDY